MASITAACKADIPGIIITADRSPAVMADVSAAGFALLQKPVKPAALRALISQMIARQHAAE
jgi:CheY-like chemotaxis protein